MTSKDRGDFIIGLTMLTRLFRVPPDDLFNDAYWAGVKDKLSIEAFTAAVNLALEECEKMPVPIEITRLGRRAMREAMLTRGLPPISEQEKKMIRESWPEKAKDGKDQ